MWYCAREGMGLKEGEGTGVRGGRLRQLASHPLRPWWLFGSSILAPLPVREPEPANAVLPLRL